MASLNRPLAAIAVLLSLCTGSAGAQRVRGDVVQADGALPAAGIVVTASGPNGAVNARALSGANGAFDLRLPAAGTYTLSALRIGYRPSVMTGVVVADTGATVVRLVLTGGSVTLAAVAVRGNDVCGAAGDPQAQVAQVWSEARTALSAAALWSREALDAEWITYRRELKVGTEAVRSQEVRISRGATTHAFKSWDADSLAARGYVLNDAEGATYYAPDPDVLLANSFAETHCFHLEPSPTDVPGLVGVGFRPQRARNDRVDVEGTLWIERASSELRWLDFRYTGLPPVTQGASPGGRVDFLRLAQGPWMVNRWHIRMPRVGAPEHKEVGHQVTMVKEAELALRGIGIVGGMVSRVRQRGQPPYEANAGGIAMQVTRGDSSVSLALPTVKLVGTDYAWTGDSSGRVQARPVLDGRYDARISTAEMAALGVAPLEREVTILPTQTRVESVALPSAREMVKDACGNDAVKSGLGALYGIVRDSAGRAAAARAVTVAWTGATAGFRGGARIGRTTNGTLTDDAGAWRVCDVPRNRTIAVRTAGDDGHASADVTIPEDRWFLRVPLRVSASAAAVADAADSAAGTLELEVRDRAGRILDAASLELSASGGDQRKVTTDARGKALVASFPTGTVKMRAKRVGYAPGELMFVVAAGRNTVPVILDKVALPTLDTVRVVGNKKGTSRADGFETRKLRHEATASFGREEIEQRNPQNVAELLRTVGSLRLADSAGVVVAQLPRAFKVGPDGSSQPCNMRILLDGMIMPEGTSVNMLHPRELRGIEVFGSTARLPSGMAAMPGDAACGLIAIWTGKP